MSSLRRNTTTMSASRASVGFRVNYTGVIRCADTGEGGMTSL
jgi:hypothetical protein